MSKLSTRSLDLYTVVSSKDTLFSYFNNPKATKKEKDINISDYLALVCDQSKRTKAETLRALSVNEYKKAKLSQPCITGSGTTCQDRGIETKNGLVVVDFDELPECYKDWEHFKIELVNDSYTFIVHYSLSGKGLCVFVKIPIENNFKEIYLSLQEYYRMLYSANLDFLADESRLRFIAFDPEPFFNQDSLIYTDILKVDLKNLPTVLQDNEFNLDEFSSDPATVFNNSGLAGLELINKLLIELGYTITHGKEPIIFEYQRANGALRSIVAFNNKDVVIFQVFSPNTGLKEQHYNLFNLYKELKGLDNYSMSKELAGQGFGTFFEAKPIRPNGKESYSFMLDFLKNEAISLNQLTGVTEIKSVPLNDYHISNILTEISLFSGKNQSKEILLSCMDVISNGNKFHPFIQFVKELEKISPTDFNSLDELDFFIDCFESSTPKRVIRIYFIRWMLGLFDLHLHQRMTKNVLVVSGAQNSGKTSLAKNILPEGLKQYGKVVEFNQNKATDTKIALCSILIGCFDEFEDILTKSKTLSDFKNLTSAYDIFERRPYRRNHEQMFRSAIICATTNDKQILTDSTGNTRFLTLDIQAFDLNKYFTINLFKLWRVIYDYHLKGETSVLNEVERALQANENSLFEAEDFCEGLIKNIFYEDSKGFLNTTEILIELEKHTKQHLSLKRIGCALRKMGIERVAKKINGKVVKGYNLKYHFEN